MVEPGDYVRIAMGVRPHIMGWVTEVRNGSVRVVSGSMEVVVPLNRVHVASKPQTGRNANG